MFLSKLLILNFSTDEADFQYVRTEIPGINSEIAELPVPDRFPNISAAQKKPANPFLI